jgi:hypothetical protein
MSRSSRASSPDSSRAFALAGLLGLLACTPSVAIGPTDADRPRRHPDGVAVDPVSPPPGPRDRASSADGLVTLRTPLGVDRAVVVIKELFHAVVLADGEALDALFTRDPVATTSAPSGGPTQSALFFWQNRLRKHDYSKLAGEPIYSEGELQVFRAGDSLDALPHLAVHPEALGEGDVVVRVPILAARVGADRLFGDEVIVWMRRDGDRYRIYRVLEDFQLN